MHIIRAFTYPVNGTSHDGHRHRFQGITRLSDGHFHRFQGVTGPPICLSPASHVHAFYIEVDPEPFLHRGGFYRTVKDVEPHTHRAAGITGVPIGQEPLFR